MLSWRKWLPLVPLALGVASVSGMRQQYRVPPKTPVDSIALNFDGYSASTKTVSKEERQVAGMSEYNLREFRRDSLDMFTTYIGYYDYQVQGKSIHSPRNCLPGAGWETLEGGVATVARANGPAIRVNRFLMANGRSRALVYYWYQGRGRIESSEYVVKWNLLRDAALLGRTEEALVRIVVPLSSGASPDAFKDVVRVADQRASTVAATLAEKVDAVLPTIP